MIIARVFGFARYRVLNDFFAKEQLDIYYAAFRIPDFIFEVLITGALTTTLIPFYLKYGRDKAKQARLTSSILNIIFLSLAAFIIVMIVGMPYIAPLITPGFSPEALDSIVTLSRWLLIGQLPFLVFGNVLTGLAQANKIFILPAFAPVLYNVAIVVATYFLAPSLGLNSTALGVIIGAVLFFICQLIVIPKIRFSYQPVIDNMAEIVVFFKAVIPRILTVLAAQIEATIDLSLSSLLAQGSYTIFYLAQHLQLLPVSIIGIAFGQASLPYLSEMYQDEKFKELKRIVIDSLNNIFFLTVPIAGFFIVNRTAIVRLVYGASKFDWDATVLTAYTMSFFCISLPFHSVYYFLTRCFYATMDTRTPFIVTIFSIIANSILSWYVIAVLRMPVWALGLTFSVVITAQVIVLIGLFARKVGGIDLMFFFQETVKVVVASALSSLVAYDARKLLDGLIFDTSRTLNLFFLMTITFTIMLLTYLFAAWTLDSQGLFILTKAGAQLKTVKKKFSELVAGAEGVTAS